MSLSRTRVLTSIKGIGITLATALIIATGGFTYFDNAKQLSRFIGICPTIEQSGASINVRGHINRNGDETLQSQLYIAVWSARRYNKSCKECYDRLRSNGKSGKVAMIAVANKRVTQAFAIATSNTSYVDGFVSSNLIPPAKTVSLLLAGDVQAVGAAQTAPKSSGSPSQKESGE